jgi:hypothetical protein
MDTFGSIIKLIHETVTNKMQGIYTWYTSGSCFLFNKTSNPQAAYSPEVSRTTFFFSLRF